MAPIGWVAGPAGAASDRFDLTIQGRGGHGAGHPLVDPIVVGSEIIVALQTIVSREINPVLPAVITIGAFRAGEAPNVIPDTAEIRGTVRSFDPEVRQLLQKRITAIIEGIATTMRATVDLRYHLGYPPLVNEPEMTELVRGWLLKSSARNTSSRASPKWAPRISPISSNEFQDPSSTLAPKIPTKA